MHSIKFLYKRHKFDLMPIIPIILFGKDKSFATEAYVDSGAKYSIFVMEFISFLGLNLNFSRKQMFVVGDGSFIPGYIFKIPIQIKEHKFISEVAFSDKLNIGFNLLGRKGVFEEFKEVIFREDQKEVGFRF